MNRFWTAPGALHPDLAFHAGAWGQLSSTGAAAVLARSANVASATKSASGRVSVTYIQPFVSSGTAVVGSVNNGARDQGFYLSTAADPSATGFSLETITVATVFADYEQVSFAVFGHF